eukprot:8662631-Alexandrium_andersonii.AAC.1
MRSVAPSPLDRPLAQEPGLRVVRVVEGPEVGAAAFEAAQGEEPAELVPGAEVHPHHRWIPHAADHRVVAG